MFRNGWIYSGIIIKFSSYFNHFQTNKVYIVPNDTRFPFIGITGVFHRTKGFACPPHARPSVVSLPLKVIRHAKHAG